MGDYRKLVVWQRLRVLAVRVHRLVAALPPSERFELGNQLKTAANSIRNNIAEGAGLNTPRFFAFHLRRALGSANEVQDQLQHLEDVNLLRPEDADLPVEVSDIRAMVVGL